MTDKYALVNFDHVLAEFETREEATELWQFMRGLHPEQRYRIAAQMAE